MISRERLAALGRGDGASGTITAMAAGALVTLSLAPIGFWPAGILSVTWLLHLLHDRAPRAAALRGWCFGLGLYGTGVSWIYVSIHVYGYASPLLAGGLTLLFVAGLALMPAAMAWLWARFYNPTPGAVLLGFPSLWVLTEWFRAWFLTGFPWLYLGNGHLETPLSGWAPVLGVYGLSWIAAASGAVLYVFLRRDMGAPARVLGGILVAAAWLGGWQAGTREWTHELPGPALKVAAVQGNIPQDLKWAAANLRPTLERYRSLTQRHWDADLVVWPEAAVPVFLHRAGDYLDPLAAEAEASGTALVTGIPYWGVTPTRPDDPVMHNSVVGLGQASGLYHKQKLVPFGEYVPLEDVLRGLIAFFDLPMSDFRPGRKEQSPLQVEAGGRPFRLAPYICYEIVYPGFVARSFQGSELLLTISNDAWFGASLGPSQHLEIARMRALELGRDLVRGTNDGITALIDHRGRVRSQAPRFETVVLEGEVRLREGWTPFARWQSGPALVLSLILVLLVRRVRGGEQEKP